MKDDVLLDKPTTLLDGMIAWSLRNRIFVVASAALLLVYGAYTIIHLPVDVFPNLNRPTVTIMTEATGLAPEEVETLVTLPLEMAMNGAPGVTRVRSQSGIGLSIVWVEFEWGTDIYLDRQIVNERLQTAAEDIPEGILPVMAPVSSIMGEIMLIAVRSDTTTPMEVRATADWVVRRRLLTIPGISQVTVIGPGFKQYQVLLDPDKLTEYGLGVDDVEEAARAANENTTGGFIDRGGREFLVRNVGRVQGESDLADAVIEVRENMPIRLGDVAEVKVGPVGAGLRRGDAGAMGRPAVVLAVQKQPGASTIELTEKVRVAMEELKRTLPPDIEIQYLFQQADFIERAISNVEEALRDGGILVVIILFIFLANFRTTAITLTAIPLSLVVTALIFKWFDISINTMTLGGLAIAIGELVDDAIVDIENVFRRLKENQHAADPLPAMTVIYRASSEVRNSIVFATIIVILVFLPLFNLSGIEGRIFIPLGIAYVVSIAASLVVSLTVTPALAYYLLPRAKFMEHAHDTRFVSFLKRIDRKQLEWTLSGRRPWYVMGAAGIAVLLALFTVPFMGREFLPQFNEGTATINVLAMPGTSLEESARLATGAEKMALTVPEVVSTGRRTGRAELDEHAEGVHYTELDVDFKPSDRDRETILGDLRDKLGQIPSILVNIGQPISHRIDHLLSGVRAQMAVKIFGPDLAELRRLAGEIEGVLKNVEGIVDLQVEQQVLIPQLRIRVRRDAATRYGVRSGDLTEILQTALAGEVVSEVIEGDRQFDLVVRLKDSARGEAEAIRSLLLPTTSGARVTLGTIADVDETLGPNAVNHENSGRRMIVSANIADRDLGGAVEEIQNRIKEHVTMPEGYYVTYGGQFESQQEATRVISILSIFALAGMFLVLYTHFNSARIVWQVLLNIPLALIGSVTAIWLTDGILSVATLVGFITLTGIASRNTIMMISHYIHIVEHEGEHWSKEMIIRGSLERLVPVLMTAAVAGLALIPLVLAKGEPGKEILYPVAVVILGGLTSSTILDMIVTPAVFWKFGRPALARFLESRASKVDQLGQDQPAHQIEG